MDEKQIKHWILRIAFFLLVAVMIVASIIVAIALYFDIKLTEHKMELFSIGMIVSIAISLLILKYIYDKGILHPNSRLKKELDLIFGRKTK